jgi:outer membrane protein
MTHCLSRPRLLSLSLLSVCLFPLSSHALTLAEAVKFAIERDAGYAASLSSVKAAEEQPEQAKAQLKPSLSLSSRQLTESYRMPSSSTGKSTRQESIQSHYLQFSQPIYNPKLWRSLSLAEQRVVQAKLIQEKSLQDLIAKVGDAYFSVLLQQAYLQLSIQQRQTIEDRLAQVTAAMEVGYASQLDVNSLQAERDDMLAKQLLDEQQLILARKHLAQITGQSLPDQLTLPKIDTKQLLTQLVSSPDEFLSAISHNLLVQIKVVEADIARNEVAVRESEHAPTVNLGGYYSQTDGTNYLAQKFDDQVVYVELSLPLYQGGMTDSRVREGKAQSESLEQQVLAQTRDTHQQVQQALASLTTSGERLTAIHQAISSGEIYLESIEEGFRLGLRDISEVSRAKAQLLTNKREQVKTQLDFVSTILRLYTQVGQLTPETIAQLDHQLVIPAEPLTTPASPRSNNATQLASSNQPKKMLLPTSATNNAPVMVKNTSETTSDHSNEGLATPSNWTEHHQQTIAQLKALQEKGVTHTIQLMSDVWRTRDGFMGQARARLKPLPEQSTFVIDYQLADGRQRIALIYGSYSGNDSAESALQTLPQEVLKHQPMLKRLDQIIKGMESFSLTDAP